MGESANDVISIRIELGERSYPILIGAGVLDAAESWTGLPRCSVAVIVTNTTVAPLYAARVGAALSQLAPRVLTVELPDGEAHKDWPTLDLLFDRLLEAGCDRRTLLVALGGGVVGDMTGFAAACYMRGVPFVQVPTTLLAQVDSSVGGKTAINHSRGKNMIGAFHQPLRVLADLDTLATLPQREYVSGLAEVIKYGPIADDGFTRWVDANLETLLARERRALAHAVRRSCEIKADVVARDERESGLREILNFGHTFGHAIEAALGYGTWLHGEAVGCGMVLAADLSARLGLISEAECRRVASLVERAGLPTRVPRIDAKRLIGLMRVDKKALHGEVRFVLLDAPGRACVRGAPDELVRSVIDSHQESPVAA